MSEQELKPCPHCGLNSAYILYNTRLGESDLIGCSQCGFASDITVDQWNARAEETKNLRLCAEIVELRRELEDCRATLDAVMGTKKLMNIIHEELKQECDELANYVERLREASLTYTADSYKPEPKYDAIRFDALVRVTNETPTQSLQQHDNKLIEKCAAELNADYIGNRACTSLIKELREDVLALKR